MHILAHRLSTENIAPRGTLLRRFHGTMPTLGDLPPGALHLTLALTVLQQPLREVPPQHQFYLPATARPFMAHMRVQPKRGNALPPPTAVESIGSGMKRVREAAPQAKGNPPARRSQLCTNAPRTLG